MKTSSSFRTYRGYKDAQTHEVPLGAQEPRVPFSLSFPPISSFEAKLIFHMEAYHTDSHDDIFDSPAHSDFDRAEVDPRSLSDAEEPA